MTTRQETPAEVTSASTEALLDAIIRLTHIIHERPEGSALTRGFRAQRDLARAEILRRTGDAG